MPTTVTQERSDFRVSIGQWSAPAAGRVTLTLRDTAVFELATLQLRETLADNTTGYVNAVMCVGCNGTCAGCGGCGGGCSSLDQGL